MHLKGPASVGEARRRLPREFLDSLAAGFAPNDVDRILHGMGAERPTTLRVNTLRWSARELIRFLLDRGVKHRRVVWYQDAFVLPFARERDVERWEPYQYGRIYLQSLSSVVPVLVLDPRPGESVLDIAAAPGSKTTQIAAAMRNQGRVLANEQDPIRAQRLMYNLRLQGCVNVEVRVGRGEKLPEETTESFDRVLLDVPCSGEGRFVAGVASTYRSWSPRLVSECVKVQRKLIAAGVRALRPGGVLVYATCTLNKQENENQIDNALESLPVKIERPSLSPPGAQPTEHGFRIFPTREMEGFFVCRMRKV